MRRRNFIAGLGAAAWPLTARAQQSASTVVGFLDFYGPRPKSPFVEAFRAGLAEGGFIEGRNLSIEYRWGRGNPRQVEDFAAELVSRPVALIFAFGALAGGRCGNLAEFDFHLMGRYQSIAPAGLRQVCPDRPAPTR
jgi:hypothetical protein